MTISVCNTDAGVLPWGYNANMQLNMVLQEPGNPNSGNTKDLVTIFITQKVLESTR
jgi:hypothetical protein